jgi:hypothetical protein
MAEMTKDEMIRVINDSISRLENKEFNVYFFVLDTKGNPSSSLEYIYQMALSLSNMGYNVTMLHNEAEFVGVGEWLGEAYSNLKHLNIEKDNVPITASDFLFIPEIFANVMMSTKKLPCKRVIIVQNYLHVTEFLPVSQTMDSLNITDAIVTTRAQEEKIREYFPELRTHIVSPAINKMFRNYDGQRKLIVNVVAKEQSDINQIVKPFYWKNPIYKWVSFRDLRGMDQETFAEGLRKAAITVWIDDKTSFGYSLLEALRCGGVILAKVPERLSDWMVEDGKLTESVIWFDNVDDVPDMLSSLVRAWTHDEIPAEVYEEQNKFSNLYTTENQSNEIISVYVEDLFAKRLSDFREALADVENNVLKVKED